MSGSPACSRAEVRRLMVWQRAFRVQDQGVGRGAFCWQVLDRRQDPDHYQGRYWWLAVRGPNTLRIHSRSGGLFVSGCPGAGGGVVFPPWKHIQLPTRQHQLGELA